jgi:hypothetical protein
VTGCADTLGNKSDVASAHEFIEQAEWRPGMSERALIIIVVAIGVIVAIVVTALLRRSRQKRSERLRGRFCPEYDRVVAESGDRAKAEKVLEEREKRSRDIVVRPLAPQDRDHFAEAWRLVQARFVDAPGEAVIEADHLLEQLMSQRGYPVGRFEQQADDISVDHPQVVENYRRAHEIADRQRRGEANTEDLREAVIQYRALYEELLGPQPLIPNEVNR